MLGILCGLESEAKIARRVPGALVACAAAQPGKARVLARELVEKGATRLMSFGVAGGLRLGVPVGALVIGSRVVSPTGAWDCDSAWADNLAQKLSWAERGGVWGSETLVPTGVEKIAIHKQSGCVVVDMESQCAAEVALAAKLPLAVLRVVCDTAEMNVPPVVMATIKDNGSTDVLKAIAHLARRPREIPDLFHLTSGISKALGVLKKSLIAF